MTVTLPLVPPNISINLDHPQMLQAQYVVLSLGPKLCPDIIKIQQQYSADRLSDLILDYNLFV